MAGIRDPAFWKRFSVAVHLDEEQQKEVKQEDSWLARQRAKRARRTYVCYGFWVGFIILIGLVAALIYWLIQQNKDGSGGPTSRRGLLVTR